MDATLAEALWNARLSGGAIAVEAAEEPASAAAAYGLQAAMVAVSGMDRVGWKIGATTKASQELLAVDQPFLGPLFAPHCHANGAEITLAPAQSPGLETEFLVGLAADLPARARAYQRDEVAAAVAFVAPAFEIVGARFAGGLKGKGLLAIADGGANVAIVQGEPVRDWQRFDLGRHGLRLNVNGAEVAAGDSSVLVFGDPIGAVAWLASHPLLGDGGLKAGDIVMTGTCTGLTPLHAGDRAVGDFGELGQVRASFV